jgi:hypothetical protein
MRVAFVSTCGAGHLNSIRSVWERDPESHLFLLRFRDEAVPFTDTPRVTVLTVNRVRPDENAAYFNSARNTATMYDALHVWLADFAPTLIVYDFFCWEAYHVSRVMGIPAICSIPATLKPYETTTCSDANLMKEHFYWVWRDPYPVAISPVAFLGPARSAHARSAVPIGAKGYGSMIVVTFGTVVPTYAGCQERLNDILSQIKIYARKHPKQLFVFAGIQGSTDTNCISLPAKECDLPALLADDRVDCLIFHGGGNTYAEALDAHVPFMLVCPFFGDQFETARQCGNMWSGNLEKDMDSLKPTPAPTGRRTVPFADRFPDYWKLGDLLFGHRRHRAALQRAFPQVDLHLEHYAPFETFANPKAGDLPAIADVYNDQLGPHGPGIRTGDDSPFGERLVQVAAKRQESQDRLKHLPDEHKLVHYCLLIMDITIQCGGRIHFVLGPLNDLGEATHIELTHIVTNWSRYRNSVLFFDLQGRRIPAPLTVGGPKSLLDKETIPKHQLRYYDQVSLPLSRIPSRIPLIWGRAKSSISIDEKRTMRNLPILDKLGWRTTYLNKDDLAVVQAHLNPDWNLSVNWCNQRVWYYYYSQPTVFEPTELQVWPYVYLHCFYLDQAGQPTIRALQHLTQDFIEKQVFVDPAASLAKK